MDSKPRYYLTRSRTGWSRINLWHEHGSQATRFTNLAGKNATTIRGDADESWGQVGFGVAVEVARNVDTFASGDYNFAIDSSRASNFSARGGLRIKW